MLTTTIQISVRNILHLKYTVFNSVLYLEHFLFVFNVCVHLTEQNMNNISINKKNSIARIKNLLIKNSAFTILKRFAKSQLKINI